MGYEYVLIDGERVEVNVAVAFTQLKAEFRRIWGLGLIVSSGTRTRAEQAALYAAWIAYKNGEGPEASLAAPPGESNHEEDGPRGPRALDLRDTGPDAGVAVIGTPRSIWMRDNCTRFGFTNTGYDFDPQEAWHIEFGGEVGVPASIVIHEKEHTMGLRIISSPFYRAAEQQVIHNGLAAQPIPNVVALALREGGVPSHDYDDEDGLNAEIQQVWQLGSYVSPAAADVTLNNFGDRIKQ